MSNPKRGGGVLARQREVQNDVAAITGIYENAESFWEHRVKNAHKRADTCTICINAVPQSISRSLCPLRTAYPKCSFAGPAFRSENALSKEMS